MQWYFQTLADQWLGLLVGLVGIAVGIVGIFHQRKGRLVMQWRGQRLIEGGGGLLPDEVNVTFKGVQVDRLSRTQIAFWNKGSAALRGQDLVEEDPIRFKVSGRILKIDLVKITRSANAISIKPSSDPDEVGINFKYLNKNDGALLEVLHTGGLGEPRSFGSKIDHRFAVENLGQAIDTRFLRRMTRTEKIIHYAVLFILWSIFIGMVYLILTSYKFGPEPYSSLRIAFSVFLFICMVMTILGSPLVKIRPPEEIDPFSVDNWR